MRRPLTVLCSALAFGCSGDSAPDKLAPKPFDAPRTFTLAWQANVNGDIEPCG